MVDSISQSGGAPGIKRTAESTTGRLGAAKPGTATAAAPSAAGDTMNLSAAATTMPSDLKAGPPIEMELVTQLQERIRNGEYPIDLDKITESLFESYLELNG